MHHHHHVMQDGIFQEIAHTAVRAVTWRSVSMLMHGHGLVGGLVVGAGIILVAWLVIRAGR